MEKHAKTIRPVHTNEQIRTVALLARRIWEEHYIPITGRPQIDYMLEKFQSPQAIARQIVAGYEYYLIRYGDVDAGYLAIAADESRSSVKISKIYVHKKYRGGGLGRYALEFVEEICRKRRLDTIRLTVNRNNSHSIEWYERQGFHNCGPHLQDIGNGFVMDDFLMEKRIRQL